METDKMNILVTGANGQLGREMRIVARDCAQWRFYFSDVAQAEGLETIELDITDAQAVRTLVQKLNISCIVNCAAYTNVDRAETDVDLCRRLNAEAPAILAEAMKQVDGLLVHISTDYVFGGEGYNVPCREDQKGYPTGVYGQTKLEGEQAIKASGCSYAIIRTAWLYSEFGKNFVKTMLALTASKPALTVVFDQAGTPTYALDLARVIVHIIDLWVKQDRQPMREVFHYSNEGVCSWYDFTIAIAQMAGHTGCDIQPCHSSEYPSPVTRPAYSVLDKTKIKHALGIRVPYWRDSLEICINNLLKPQS